MRLKKVHISNYKNLRNFDLAFEGDSFLEVFVGKNGSGKSNLFEALIEIFRHLNELDTAGDGIDFAYAITYEIDGRSTSIEWKNGQLKINGRDRKTLGKSTPLPDNILVYYSGHNDTVTRLIEKYAESFRRRLRSASPSDDRFFIGVDSGYKELLLTTVLLLPEDSLCRKYICERLGIRSAAPDFRITLKRPLYAAGNAGYDVESNDDATRFWKAEGVTKEFLELLYSCATIQPERGPIIPQGYQANDDKYVFYINSQKIRDAFSDKAPHELFTAFDRLKVIEMLAGLSIELELTNGEPAYTRYFSDGQLQSVYIYAITELFREKHCLTLLDEPDSFLHPEWQHEFLGQIFDISEAAARTNHTLLSSHSASTISSSNDSLISLFEIDGNTVKVSRIPKGEVITSLSAGLITFSESEARLSIQQVLNNTSGPVLFTEGISDDVILETAWKKLYGTKELPFAIQNAFCAGFLGSLLRRGDLQENHPGRIFFGLFDFDEAYNEWKGCSGDVLEADPDKCLTRKLKNKECYAMLLPVPQAGAIRAQVVNGTTGAHFEHNSRLAMELLFHGIQSLSGHFEIDPSRPGNVIRFVGDKVRFAKEVVPTLPPQHFKVFEPIFDFVKSKCGSPTAAASTS